jgi:hypothetical protein
MHAYYDTMILFQVCVHNGGMTLLYCVILEVFFFANATTCPLWVILEVKRRR